MSHPQHRPGAGNTSFLPEDYVQRRTEARANLLTLTLFAVVLLGVVGAFLVTNRAWNTIRMEQEAINVEYTQEASKIDQLKELERQREQMIEKAEITAALIERVPRSVLLAEIINRMPGEVTILELELKSTRVDTAPPPATAAQGQPAKITPKVRSLMDLGEGGKPDAESSKVKPPKYESGLRLVGVARGNEQIADYLAALKASPLITRVELVYINEATIDKQSFRKFEVLAAIRPDADARQALKAAPPENRQASETDAPASSASAPSDAPR
ncbi:MAG: PilN domain-containing protein [Phycisphaerae bacterium]|nr:PilN domain-containing protein [Phycisphaerae bacterium]